MKKTTRAILMAALLTTSVTSYAKEKIYNCGYVYGNKLVKVENHVFDAWDKKRDFFYFEGHKYEITHYERIGSVQNYLTNGYVSIDGSHTEAGIAYEGYKSYLFMRDIYNKEVTALAQLNCVRVK